MLAGFWPQPIQWIGVTLGIVCSLAAFALGVYGIAYWIGEDDFPGPLFGGAAIVFVLGIQGFILALVGEYLGRIQRDVEGRPLYTIEQGAMSKRVLVTGGAGFISSNVVRHLLAATPHEVVSLDALTYAGNIENLADVMSHERLSFVEGDIRDAELVRDVVAGVDVIVNAAAESHVEKSIREGASEFVTTNVEGTQILLDAVRETPVERFVLISSSEVYGTAEHAPMDEEHPAQPAQPVRGDEGGRRPARVRVRGDVRPADRHPPAVQQLRAEAASREARPALHHERARGRAADGARRRLGVAGLAVRRRRRRGDRGGHRRRSRRRSPDR